MSLLAPKSVREILDNYFTLAHLVAELAIEKNTPVDVRVVGVTERYKIENYDRLLKLYRFISGLIVVNQDANWILSSGFWNDSKFWIDTSNWID